MLCKTLAKEVELDGLFFSLRRGRLGIRCEQVKLLRTIGVFLFFLLLGRGQRAFLCGFVQQLSELEPAEQLLQLLGVGFLHLQSVHVERDGHVLADSGEPLALLDLFDVVLHLFAECSLEFRGRSQQVFDASELLDEFLRRLLAHARTARDVIDGIAHESQHVDDLPRRLQSPLLLHVLGAENLCLAVSSHRRTIHPDALRDELPIVLVGRHHVGLDAPLVSLLSQRADDVVGLVALHFEHRNAVGGQYLLDDGYGEADGLGRFLSLCLVFGEGLVAERRAVGVEGNAQMCGLTLRHHIIQRVDEAQNGRRVLSLRVDARILDKGVISAINQCVSIQ